MVNVRQPRDVAQILLSVLFLAIMIVACLWIVQPFILGFAWAGTVVIATWPVLLRLQISDDEEFRHAVYRSGGKRRQFRQGI